MLLSISSAVLVPGLTEHALLADLSPVLMADALDWEKASDATQAQRDGDAHGEAAQTARDEDGGGKLFQSLRLVDPAVNHFNGQVIYLDFDGATDVTYRGPVVVEHIGVPMFTAPMSNLTGASRVSGRRRPGGAGRA